MSDEPRPDPLPEGWLPEPAGPPEGSPEWEARVHRLVRAAGPRLEARRAAGADVPAAGAGPGWWLGLGGWLRPAAGLAAAAVLLLLVLGPERPARSPESSAALAAAASEGEPAALWRAAGAEADPVLALIALEEEAP